MQEVYLDYRIFVYVLHGVNHTETGIFLFMHDPIAEKDCVHMFRRTLSPQDRTCHWFSEYCLQYNSYGLKQARTKMRLFRVGANFYETFTEKHSASLPRRFPFFSFDT